MKRTDLSLGILMGLLCLFVMGACGPPKSKTPTTRPAGTVADRMAYQSERRNVVMQGTVGAVAFTEGTRFMRVRGYGLVWGLEGTGSRFCPPAVREEVLREIRRFRLAHPHVERDLTAEELVDSMNTAVVEVVGDIPAAVPKGTTFDVFVSASSVSPDTRSLAGGYLLPCELRIFREATPSEIIEGRVHAKARGPLFINPFTMSGEDASGTNLLEGRVIGGGVNLEDRRLSLNTVIESYATARQVMDAINARFNSDPKVANATGPSHIELTVPKQVMGYEDRFVELLMHLPLSPIPAVQEAKAKVLTSELTRAGGAPEDAALILEGIGPSTVTLLQELYTHPMRQGSYYAARTGLRLSDELALEIVARHASDPRSPYRMAAIRELGDCAFPSRAKTTLRELLSDTDTRIRVHAYEALRRLDRSSMYTVAVGRDPGNFILDVVPAGGKPLIYARRTKTRRLVLIGADHMRFNLPLFYGQPDSKIVVSAKADDKLLTVLRKEFGKVVGEFKLPLSVELFTRFMGDDPQLGLDGKPKGLGLDYAIVFDVLYHLCDSRALNGDVKWEEPSVEDLVGPLQPMGRPESEL